MPLQWWKRIRVLEKKARGEEDSDDTSEGTYWVEAKHRDLMLQGSFAVREERIQNAHQATAAPRIRRPQAAPKIALCDDTDPKKKDPPPIPPWRAPPWANNKHRFASGAARRVEQSRASSRLHEQKPSEDAKEPSQDWDREKPDVRLVAASLGKQRETATQYIQMCQDSFTQCNREAETREEPQRNLDGSQTLENEWPRSPSPQEERKRSQSRRGEDPNRSTKRRSEDECEGEAKMAFKSRSETTDMLNKETRCSQQEVQERSKSRRGGDQSREAEIKVDEKRGKYQMQG